MKSTFRAIVGLAVAITATACAGDVQDIDRTQPNKIQKSIFQGEWHYRPTVVSVQYGQGLLFEGLEGDMERIRWDIRENVIIAYRSYEQLIGAETGNGGAEFQGAPVAMFRVESHFDIKRQYNEATGEQSNVLVENDFDRPWYERDYMRVDWSSNLLNSWTSLQASVEYYASTGYYVQEHEVANPYKPRIGPNYVDIVGNYTLRNSWMFCYIYFGDVDVCGNTDAKVRLSFKKVEPSDYRPMYYPDVYYVRDEQGNVIYDSAYDSDQCTEMNEQDNYCERLKVPIMERFGFFRHQRNAYDDEWQWTRDNRVYLAHRWNIWDGWNNTNNGNKLPAGERVEGQVPYYKNVDFPPDVDIHDASTTIVDEWDSAFRETVAQSRNVAGTQGAPGGGVWSRDHVNQVFQLRENSCNVSNVEQYASANGYRDELAMYGISRVTQANLKEACSVLEWASDGSFEWQRPGDLRYSFFHWVDTPHIRSPLGYGPSAADPVTGEIISANANVYGAAVDAYAAYAADLVAILNGDLELDDVLSGQNVREHIESVGPRFGAHDPSKMQAVNSEFFAANGGPWNDTPGFRERNSQSAAPSEPKVDRIKGTAFERQYLMSDEIARVTLGPDHYQPGQPLADAFGEQSPVDVLNPEMMEVTMEARMDLARKSIMMAEDLFEDPGLISLARNLRDQNLNWEDVYAFMRKEVYRAVMAHEVGHTLGLRHNFGGSFDAQNFHPEFWDHYDENAQKVQFFDSSGLPTGAEQYMYSSIMDYSARFYADDFQGIGPYDVAAIKFGYGGLIEEWNMNVPYYVNTFKFYHGYDAIPKILSGADALSPNCTAATCDDDWIEISNYGSAANSHYQDYLDELGNGNEAAAQAAYDEYLLADYQYNAAYTQYFRDALKDVSPAGGTQQVFNRTHTTLENVIERFRSRESSFDKQLVEYNFCPDEGNWYLIPSCKTWDKGASFHQIAQDRMVRYDQYYAFTHFKRDRYGFGSNPYSTLSSMYSRYFGPLSTLYSYYLYSLSSLGVDLSGVSVTLQDMPVGKDWQAAALDGLNFLNSVITQPEPGEYCLNNQGDTDPSNDIYEPLAEGATCTTDQMEVPFGTGRYLLSTWTEEDNYKPTRIGAYWDKLAALLALTNNRNRFFRDVSTYFDAGAFSFSPWSRSDFHDEVMQAFDWAFTGEESPFAWRYDGGAPVTDPAHIPVPMVDIYDGALASLVALPKIQSSITSQNAFSLRWYGAFLSTARFNGTFDYTTDFSSHTRVCQDSSITCRVVGNELSFRDPLTGYNYIANQTSSPNAPAIRVLTLAQDYVDNEYTPAKDDYDASHDASGNPDLTGCGPLDPPNTPCAWMTTEEQNRVTAGTASPTEIAFERQARVAKAELGVLEKTSFINIVEKLTHILDPN